MAQSNLFQLLKHASEGVPKGRIWVYRSQTPDRRSWSQDYSALLEDAKLNSYRLQNLVDLESVPIVLLYFDDYLDGLTWFWSVVAAGAVPCILGPLSGNTEHQRSFLRSIRNLLNDPLVITTNALASKFVGLDLSVRTIADIELVHITSYQDHPGESKHQTDLAVLMLTSGSTGGCKAVSLRHGQILEAVKGKSEFHQTQKNDVFLNWIGLDHVAGLIETHLHALSLTADQIHIPSAVFITDPIKFLGIIEERKVSYTFAPNFFLAQLVSVLKDPEGSSQSDTLNPLTFDLSSLRALISGGEANTVKTCVKLTDLLRLYGAPTSFIRPGFGMTETCAGAIYALDCPAYDVAKNSEFACLGSCIPGIEIIVVRDDGTKAATNEVGMLEIRGPVVFNEYYNNRQATVASFSAGGWFKTGDRAFVDTNTRLHFVGRDKDIVVINGVNHSSRAIEAAIEDTAIPGLTSSFTTIFPHRPTGAATETLCVVYLPTYDLKDVTACVNTALAISKTTLMFCGVLPYKIIPLDASLFQKSSLGKLSRSKIRQAFENGDYRHYQEVNKEFIRTFSDTAQQPAFTNTQQMILDVYNELFPNEIYKIGINSDLFKIGFSSIGLVQLRSVLQKRTNIDVPLTTIFANPLVTDLASALDTLHNNKNEYDPVCVLQSRGTKTPLWLLHPGVGEIIIFMDIARHIKDRPVYALRARGFNGEDYFQSMKEMIKVYHEGIKRVQPTGPYALAGYSYGSMIAFELTKLMTSQGDKVKFLATIDQPPFFKERAKSYDWYECILTISFFLGFIKEDYAYSILREKVRPEKWTHKDVLKHIFDLAPAHRVEELGQSPAKLDNWANLAFQLKKIIAEYGPAGKVEHMDIFYTGPLVGLVPANTLQEWYDGFISKWGEFVQEPKYHVVEGTHRTLINQPHILGFQKAFKKALVERGL